MKTANSILWIKWSHGVSHPCYNSFTSIEACIGFKDGGGHQSAEKTTDIPQAKWQIFSHKNLSLVDFECTCRLQEAMWSVSVCFKSFGHH